MYGEFWSVALKDQIVFLKNMCSFIIVICNNFEKQDSTMQFNFVQEEWLIMFKNQNKH